MAAMSDLQGTLDALDVGLVRFDRALRLRSWNRRLFEMMEYPSAMAVEGTPFLDFVRFNIDRGEHGEGARDAIIRDRLAHRYRSYARHRLNGTLVGVRSSRLPDGGFLKIFSCIGRFAEATPLTPRQTQVLAWAARGKTAAETAIILGVSRKAVEAHLALAAERLGAATKTHAVALALTAGLLSLD